MIALNFKIFFVLVVILELNHAFNILAIVSLPMSSHYMAFKRLFRELANRGHSVTVLNNFPEKNPPENLKFVDLKSKSINLKTIRPMIEYEDLDPNYRHLQYFYSHLMISPSGARADCENLLKNKNVMDFRKNNIRFDVIFVEQFRSDCGLAFASILYDAPIIGITSHTLFPWDYPRLGIPFDFGADAFYFSQAGRNPSFYYKLESYLMNLLLNNVGRWFVWRNIVEVFNEHIPNVPPNVEEEALKKMKMMFVYQHYSITGARLLSPQILEIAGMHIGSQKQLPDELEKILSSAKHGVIYVSFGSNLKVNTLSERKILQFLNAFKKLPYIFLWKVDNISLTFDRNKVYVQSWFPQLDVLCHPKVLGFVSHGGMLSMSESAHCGKPLITIPFFGDQFSNAAAASDIGLGIKLDFSEADADSLAAAIKRLTTPEMQEKAKQISKLWHDRPQNVLESAIYWTEYVARHRTAPSALPSSRNTWFQFSLIDVYCVIGIIVCLYLITNYAVFKIVKFTWYKFVKYSCRKKQKKNQ